MRKKTIICSAMLMLLAATALLFDSSVSAATLKNDDTIISDSTEKITISTDSEGRTVYKLTDDVTNGLNLTLSENEIAVLDGQGHTIYGRTGQELGELRYGSCGLSVSGSGALIIKNVTIIGGSNNRNYSDTNPGVKTEGDVDIQLTGSAEIVFQGGTIIPNDYATYGHKGLNGANGMEFSGDALILDEGTNVTIEGSSGSKGQHGANERGPGDGGAAGNALLFNGDYMIMKDSAALTLLPGTPGQGGPDYAGYTSSPGAVGYSLNYAGGLVSTKVKKQSDFTINQEQFYTLTVDFVESDSYGNTIFGKESYMTGSSSTNGVPELLIPSIRNYQYLNTYTDFELKNLLERNSSIDLDSHIYLAYKPIYKAVLNENSIVFDTQRIGYPSVSANTVTITSTGLENLENLDVTLVGADASCFELDKTGMAARLDKEDGTVTSTTFTVRPKDGLKPAGRESRTYTADIKVTATDYEETCGTIRFTVNASNRFPVKIMNTSQVRIDK